MAQTFEDWVDSLEPQGNLDYWADCYTHFCKELEHNWAGSHGRMDPARKFREHLLSVAKREVLTTDLSVQHPSRVYLWTIEAFKADYDALIPTGGKHPSRFVLATIYELGEILLHKNSPHADRNYVSQDVRDLVRIDLHRRCSWLRAKIRQELDALPAEAGREDPGFFEFIGHDLACAFEWKRGRLIQFGLTFEGLTELKQRPRNQVLQRPQQNAPYSLRAASGYFYRFLLHWALKIRTPRLDSASNVPPSPYEQNTCEIEYMTMEILRSKLARDRPLLIVTVKGDEFEALFSLLEPYEAGTIYAGYIFLSRVYLGKLSKRTVILTQCEMGSTGLGASQAITELLLDTFSRIRGVIAVGFCFGIDPITQKFGDIVVAEFIQPYENQRINPHPLRNKFRTNYHLPSGPNLIDAFKEFGKKFNLDTETLSISQTIHFGGVLSGEKVIDNADFRDELVSTWPGIAGGEMEGVGIYTAVFGRPGVQAILVKSICDFADGRKHEKWQKYCGIVCAEYCKDVLKRQNGIDLALQSPEDDD